MTTKTTQQETASARETKDLYTAQEIESIRKTNRQNRLARMSTSEQAKELLADIELEEQRTGKTSERRGELYDLTH